MPNSKSAKKRMRQTLTRNERNRRRRSQLRTAIRRVRESQNPEDGMRAFRTAERLLDRAAGKRLVHPNAAARTKARLRRLLTGLS